MIVDAFELLDRPFAIVGEGLVVVRANRATAEWLGVEETPPSLAALLPGLATPRARDRLAKGRTVAVEMEIAGAGGAARLVEISLRPARIEGKDLFLLEGFDLSKLQASKVMLQEFSRTIETNNRQLEVQRTRAQVRNTQMRLVLDHVQQGLLVIERDGSIGPERSAAVDSMMGVPREDDRIWTYLARLDATLGEWFELCFEELFAGLLPRDVLLSMMPAGFVAGGRSYEMAYELIDGPSDQPEEPTRLMMIVTDVTTRIEKERAEIGQRELLAALDSMLDDRRGFQAFILEADRLVCTIVAADVDTATLQRALHTLKGNCGLFGVLSVASLCHVLESTLAEEGRLPPSSTSAVATAWSTFRQRVGATLSAQQAFVELYEDEYERFVEALSHRTVDPPLLRAVAQWRDEPARAHLERFAERAHALGAQLGRPLDVRVEANGIRLPREGWDRFWPELVHVVRNAVDHGIEDAPERHAAGKDLRATLRFSAEIVGDEVVIAISDDGRGIDWSRVAEAAKERGIEADTHAERVACLFARGLTTRQRVSQISGRGVGLDAVKAACDRLCGAVEVESEPGRGSTFRFRIPLGSSHVRVA